MQYNLSLEDVSLCKTKNAKSNQLAFGVMLSFFKIYTQFPLDKEFTISSQLILQVANNLGIDPVFIVTFDWSGRNAKKYRQDIRQYLGYRVTNTEDIALTINYLVDNLIPRHLSDSVLLEQTRLYFAKNKIEIVSTKQLEHYILLANQKFEQQFLGKIFNNLNQEDLLLIDRILSKDSDEDHGVIELSELKQDIAGAKIKNVQDAIDKINLLGQIKLSDSIVDSVDRKLLFKYYERVMAFAPSNILDFTPTIKYATMAIFCRVRLELLLDSLADTMIKLVKKMRSSAEKRVDRYILQEVKRVDGKFDILEKLAVLNAKNPKGIIEEKVYPVVSQDICIFGIGSNTGLKRISIANDDVNYSDLRYIKKRHINAVNIRNAIRILVNNVLKIRDPNVWGEATTTVACDSTHLFAWDQNLMSEWHFRYRKKGVMIYWHVDKKSLCIYSQLKDCSSSEVGSMIKGIIDHDTDMDMNRVFVDTHGQNVIGFAVSYLLHFALYPRLKAINKQKLYYVDSGDKNKYKNLAEILKGSINWQLIEDNYDEIVKHMVALKLGIVTPSVLIKRFSNNNYTHPVYKALVELGKANKTIFLCKYLASEELRIEVNEGLNVVERLNSVMDFIFYGKLGQIATNNIEDQELSVLCLHLLQVCMVYINTLIIQQILSQPHWQNRFTPEDYRALTPLFSGHINPYGLFPLDFSKRLSIGIII